MNNKIKICEFIMIYVADPRNRVNDRTSTIPSGSSTFVISDDNALGVKSITGLTRFRDYDYDYDTKTITFLTATSENKTLTYLSGDAWILPNTTDKLPTEDIFPLVIITNTGGSSNRLGFIDAPMESIQTFSVEVNVKENAVYDGVSNQKLADNILYNIMEALNNRADILSPLLYNYVVLSNPSEVPYNDRLGLFRASSEIQLSEVTD